ncbi:hypothetical protein [Otariodibacter sp.]|uniref:hypothetical protein n=1 Tax=Otariodibacter sp. TaxID=3030919 RepID=UPI002628CAFA|nr:hypothetical protein [Otariodibacter sp.]
MPINFQRLLQESWNFMRNQANFSLFGVGLLVILQLIGIYFLPTSTISQDNMQSVSSMKDINMLAFASSIIWAVLSIWVNILLILNIKSINAGQYRSFFSNIGGALKGFLPVIFLNLIMVMPLAFASSLSGVSVATGNSLPIMGIVVMVLGVFIFVKYSLVTYVYLVESPRKSISETLRLTWAMSRAKMKLLSVFCGITYLLPLLINLLIGQTNGDIGILVVQIVGSFINVFMVIFSFRFYQIYRELPIVQGKR